MMRTIGFGVVLAAFAAASIGCEADDPCDEGQKQEQGVCVPEKASGSSGRGGGGGSSGRDGGSGDMGGSGRDGSSATPKDSGSGDPAKDAGPAAPACDEDRDAILGKACSADGNCNCAAPYCAKMPGAAMGFCTVYCKPDPDDCPDGYMCFDLAKLGVTGYDPFCTKMN